MDGTSRTKNSFIMIPMTLPKKSSLERRRKQARKRISNKINPQQTHLLKNIISKRYAFNPTREMERQSSVVGSKEDRKRKRKRIVAIEQDSDPPKKKFRVHNRILMEFLQRGVKEFTNKIETLTKEIRSLTMDPRVRQMKGAALEDLYNHITLLRDECTSYEAALGELASMCHSQLTAE